MNKHIPRIDWKACYLKFEEVHGGNPLRWKSWFLFPDGWRYNAYSHRGPQQAPEDEADKRRLMLIYWKMRLASVRKEERELRVSLVGLEEMARQYTTPDGVCLLQQRIYQEVKAVNEYGHEITRKVPDSADLDLDELRSRIKELEADADQCCEVIEELGENDVATVPKFVD